MNLLTLLVVVVVMTAFTSLAEPVGKNKRKRKNRNKKKNKNKTKISNLTHDPANLINLFPQCPGGDANIPSLFSGMFLSMKEIDQLVLDTQEEMKPFAARRSKTRFVQRNRVSKRIGTMSKFSASDSKNRNCCETELKVTAPGQVMVDGKSMSVVHMNHSYQYVQEGECVKPGGSCRGIGICTQIYKYAFMLLYDPELVGAVNPPVRYGRVPVKSHCECMNVGRIMK